MAARGGLAHPVRTRLLLDRSDVGNTDDLEPDVFGSTPRARAKNVGVLQEPPQSWARRLARATLEIGMFSLAVLGHSRDEVTKMYEEFKTVLHKIGTEHDAYRD